MWNAHNTVLGEEALPIYIVPVCYVKALTGRYGKTYSNIIISLHRKKFSIIMAALCNRAGHYIFALWFLLSIYLSSIFSSPNLSGRRVDVYHTSTHGVALVRI